MLDRSFSPSDAPSLSGEIFLSTAEPQFLWEDSFSENPWRNAPEVSRPRQTPLPVWEHAAPLDPLRDRDLAELMNWFQREDMTELEQDVNYRLLLLFPEPCWEEADWLFLQELL